MLTRLEIDGFKTFENLDISISPFTVILGSNAAGKSNLFDAIKLLSNLATKDINEALKDMRGEPLELFRQLPSQGRVKRISLAAEAMVDPLVRDPWGSEVKLTHTRMRYEVTLERRRLNNGLERVQVAEEAVYPLKSKDDKWVKAHRPTKAFKDAYLKYSRQNPWLTTETLPEGLSFSIHQDGRQGRNRPAGAAEATVLYSITNAEFPISSLCAKKCATGACSNWIRRCCASPSPPRCPTYWMWMAPIWRLYWPASRLRPPRRTSPTVC